MVHCAYRGFRPLYNGAMAAPILATKLYIPSLRPNVVLRSRLIEQLNEGFAASRQLTLISAPAGFGKTTLVSDWIAGLGRLEPPVRASWLSLDEADSDPARFLTYLVAALQTIASDIGVELLSALQVSPPAPIESTLTALINEIAALPDRFILVLDDYHLIEAKSVAASTSVDDALTFLLAHLPAQIYLVITTREDPDLPLARMRARGQLTELRAADLRFTPAEAAEFLNAVMGLQLSSADVAVLETRTEGWIAGLQLAALALRGPLSPQSHPADAASFIQSFTGSHHFVLDYLVEEVLRQQPESVQTFLLHTSILDRLCGPLCDAVRLAPAGSSQATLETIERANLFITPLDNDRRWYRYHHLFADLLRQRLGQAGAQAAGTGTAVRLVAALHTRASQWCEDNGLDLEAFQHAAAAQDVVRAERLVEGAGIPLTFRGAAAPVLRWLESLPDSVLDGRPALWVTYASALFFTGQNSAVEQKLRSAEAALALPATLLDDQARDLIGRIAALRATLAIMRHDVNAIIAQSRRALDYLRPDNLPVRTGTTYTLGYAYQLRGDRAAASQAYAEVMTIGKSSGESVYTLAATLSMGQVQEADNQLQPAAESYRRALQLAGDPPRGMAGEVLLGLARIGYEWNDLEAAGQQGQHSLQLARQMENVDTPAACMVFLARLKLAQGEVASAATLLDEAEQFARQHHFADQLTRVAAAQVLTLLRQGRPEAVAAAAQLAERHALPLSQARVQLAHGNPGAALAALEPARQQAQDRDWADEKLKVLVLQALALQAQGETEPALHVLGEALALAEPGGFIRTFVDEGPAMAALLRAAVKCSPAQSYIRQLLAAFGQADGGTPIIQALVEPLSERELDVLRLLGTELNGPAMARELQVSLNTLRTHTQNVYAKLGVNNRRAAVRRAEELNLL
jgi:LuxR family maltose regulon positive regulatory protein